MDDRDQARQAKVDLQRHLQAVGVAHRGIGITRVGTQAAIKVYVQSPQDAQRIPNEFQSVQVVVELAADARPFDAGAKDAMSAHPPTGTEALSDLILRVAQRPFNWDGHGSIAPSSQTAAFATEVAAKMREAIWLPTPGRGAAWVDPHVSASENGEMTFEWWRGPRKITAYISVSRIEYLFTTPAGCTDLPAVSSFDPDRFIELWLALQAAED